MTLYPVVEGSTSITEWKAESFVGVLFFLIAKESLHQMQLHPRPSSSLCHSPFNCLYVYSL